MEEREGWAVRDKVTSIHEWLHLMLSLSSKQSRNPKASTSHVGPQPPPDTVKPTHTKATLCFHCSMAWGAGDN